MKRGYSVFSQVAGLALATVAAVLLVSATVVLTTPAPSLRRMTVAQAVAALQGLEADGLARSREPRPPPGRSSPLLARTVAAALRVDHKRVRASWIEIPSMREPPPSGQAIAFIAGQEAVVEAGGGGFTLGWGDNARLSPQVQVPPFRAALRQRDGRWLTVQPKSPLLNAWRLRLLLALLFSAAILVPLCWLIARRLTRPMRTLAEAAENVRFTGGEKDVVVEGPREVRAAAAAINAMRARLLREVAERTRMLAAVAHDLRTPLTSLRVRAEAAAEPERSRMVADIGRMSTMITQVLEYAKGREANESFRRIDAAALLRACAEEAGSQGGRVELSEPLHRLTIIAAPESLRRALLNLIENALRYAGGARLSLIAKDGCALLVVEDEGEGIPLDQMDRLQEPFERAEPSRSGSTGGTGLGLAIARDVAELHGGRLMLRNRPEGGLRAVLQVPLDGPKQPSGSEEAEGRGR